MTCHISYSLYDIDITDINCIDINTIYNTGSCVNNYVLFDFRGLEL